jgi:hypothetical protein
MKRTIVLIGWTMLAIGALAIFFSLVPFPYASEEPCARTLVYHPVTPPEYASYVEYMGTGLVAIGVLVIGWEAISGAKTAR